MLLKNILDIYKIGHSSFKVWSNFIYVSYLWWKIQTNKTFILNFLPLKEYTVDGMMVDAT